MKKLAWILGASSILLLGACGDEEEALPDTPTEEEAEQADDTSENQPGVTPVEQDISTKYIDMNGVAGARVADRDGAIEARIMLEGTISEEEALKLGEEFAAELKEEYADQTVTVEIIQAGKKLKVIE